MQGLVLPGEKVDVTLTTQVNDALASTLNLGQAHLEDTLVLHTALCRDHFVAVSADYGTVKAPCMPDVWELICGPRAYMLCHEHSVARASARTGQGA